jgi:hypothetical protein
MNLLAGGVLMAEIKLAEALVYDDHNRRVFIILRRKKTARSRGVRITCK